MAAMSLWMDRWKSSRPRGGRQNGEAERDYRVRKRGICITALPSNNWTNVRHITDF